MELSEEQKNVVVLATRKLDRLQPEIDAGFVAYESAKVKCGFAAFISGMSFVGVVSGNYEIQESIGALGVGSLPMIFIGAGIYYFSARKKYHDKISEHFKAEQPLYDLGLSYTPAGRHCSKSYLCVISTREKLDLNEFDQSMYQGN